jgi:hypothetical protein
MPEAMTYLDHALTVEIHAGLDLESGRFQIVFSTLDPGTGLPPEVTLGFLPPEDGTGRGQGHVSYRIRPKPGLPSGTEIFNIAWITFDFAETIATDQVDPHDPSQGTDPARQARNTLDAAAPVSQVRPLPAESTRTTFTLEWDAADEPDGSGIAAVDLFVAVDRGPWMLWTNQPAGNQVEFTGEPGHRYAFYSVAHDYAGHIEPAPEVADTATQIASSVALTLSLQRDPQDGTLVVGWPTATDRHYTLLQAPSLEGPWVSVPGFTDLPGTGSAMLYRAAATSPAQYYRVRWL